MDRRRLLVTLGLGMAAVGLFWIAQGLGYVRWPAWSPMLGTAVWVTRGTILSVAGLVLVIVGRNLRRR